MTVLVTGATGFIGSSLVARLSLDTRHVRVVVRRPKCLISEGVEVVQVSSLNPETDWNFALKSVDIVVHSAARVHVVTDNASDSLSEFRRVNVGGSLNLARQAVSAGVRRFIFMSSIKVNGEETRLDNPFSADDVATPQDPYGISKYEAEQGLRQLAEETGLEVVIIRPPLVYGPGVKANFLAMLMWLKKGLPLPLGAIDNKRSFVALDNLVDLIKTCIDHPMAANQTFLVSDGEDLSTTELLRRMGAALGKPARLMPVPVWLLTTCAALIGRTDMAQRLCGSLQVDISKTRELLNWSPPMSVDVGLRKTAIWFLHNLPSSDGSQ